jgi:hypothetical protein
MFPPRQAQLFECTQSDHPVDVLILIVKNIFIFRGHRKKIKVLTENKTTQNRPKQHRARDETQKKEKRSARTNKAENTQKGKPKGKREKEKTPTNSRNEAANGAIGAANDRNSGNLAKTETRIP